MIQCKQKIEFEVSEEIYQKYLQHKRRCNDNFRSSINRIYKNELAKNNANTKQNKEALERKIRTQLFGIHITLNVIKDFHRKNGPYKRKHIKNSKFVMTKYKTALKGLWTSCLCQFNSLKEMLDIQIDSKNMDDILKYNPFIIWDKTFVDLRHYLLWNNIVSTKTKRDKIWQELSEQAFLALKNQNGKAAFDSVIKIIREKGPQLKAAQIEIFQKQFGISCEDAKLFYKKLVSNKIQFILPKQLPNKINYKLTENFNKWIKIMDGFILFLDTKMKKNKKSQITKNKQILWKWYKNSVFYSRANSVA